MPKPLRSDDPRPQSVQFSHFGVLDDGKRSKGAAVTSMVINGLILLIILVLGYAVKNSPKMAKQLTELTLPPEPPPPPPVKRPPPPPPPKELPTPPKIEIPKIKMVEPPPDIKPIEVPIPKPVVAAPAPPKAVTPPPAPVKVDLANPKAASIKNNDLHPTAVRMGSPDNPMSPTGPAVANVNMGQAGFKTNPANTGSGANVSKVQFGTGNPNGTNMNGKDSGNRQIAGVKLGSNGPLGSQNLRNAPVNVNLQSQATPPASSKAAINPLVAAAPPKVLYKPSPVYTAEARSLHLEGNVSVKIKVTAAGTVEVESITHGLGHGLDESARQAVLGTRFKPAVDATGRPVDWEGVVLVNFQLS